ncbi:hypothetical protein [Herpetosiphon geysericola]|nr:hypothetical protein [Herpetosiphon geysericola]
MEPLAQQSWSYEYAAALLLSIREHSWQALARKAVIGMDGWSLWPARL